MIRWWSLAVVLACLWWLVPLVVLGRYSPPFLNWIESSAVTTSQNSFIAIARGADHWQAYLGPRGLAGRLDLRGGAGRHSGYRRGRRGRPVTGLALRGAAHRLFLVSSLLLGFSCLTFGHVGVLDSPVVGSAQQLLDGRVAFATSTMIRWSGCRWRSGWVICCRRPHWSEHWSQRLLPAGRRALAAAAAALPAGGGGGRTRPGAGRSSGPAAAYQHAGRLLAAGGELAGCPLADGRTLVIPGAGGRRCTGAPPSTSRCRPPPSRPGRPGRSCPRPTRLRPAVG